jgi:hypothetical protein
MIKKIKPAFLIFIHLIFLQGISGQAQTNMAEYLSKKFLSYTSSHPWEEIYIHADRKEYLSGEDLWFNVYLLNRQSLKPSSTSKIAYVELLNPENRPVVQKMILLEDGSGPGQFILPDSLSTGTYTIRAYTNWMKNFLPNNCFIENIHVYNVFSNKIFKTKPNTGRIIKAGHESAGDQSFSDSGITLSTDNHKADILDIYVKADDKYRAQNNDQFYLFIQTHGNINRVSSEKLSGDETKISIPKVILPGGINQITLFNLNGLPVAERFIYTPEKKSGYISFHSPDSSGTRKKVSFDLEFDKLLNNSTGASEFSISVAPANSNTLFIDMVDYVVFGTEFRFYEGRSLNGINANEITQGDMDSLLLNIRSNWINWNSVLATEEPVLRFQPESEDHFISGKLLKSDHITGAPNALVIISTPGKIAGFQYARTDAEGYFSFRVPLNENVNDVIIQPDHISENQFVSISSSFSDQYLKSEMSLDSANGKMPDYISTWSVNHQVRKIYSVSSVGDQVHRSFSKPELRRFYGKPAIQLIMKDYIALPVMQEVFFELLRGVYLKNKKSGYEVTIIDPLLNTFYESPPTLFIDGVKVNDPAVIVGLDPAFVEEIDVIKERYFVGDYLFYGIINVITKAGDFNSVTLPDYAIRQPFRSVDPVMTFVSPDYSSAEAKKSRIPDFRNTLYWNSTVKPDKEGKARIEFWTSDFISDFEINIQGITPEGKVFSVKKILKIKK